jgi:hypothetical protein
VTRYFERFWLLYDPCDPLAGEQIESDYEVLVYGAWSIHPQYPGLIDVAFALAGYDPHWLVPWSNDVFVPLRTPTDKFSSCGSKRVHNDLGGHDFQRRQVDPFDPIRV